MGESYFSNRLSVSRYITHLYNHISVLRIQLSAMKVIRIFYISYIFILLNYINVGEKMRKRIHNTGTSVDRIHNTGTFMDRIHNTGTSMDRIHNTGTSMERIHNTGTAVDRIHNTSVHSYEYSRLSVFYSWLHHHLLYEYILAEFIRGHLVFWHGLPEHNHLIKKIRQELNAFSWRAIFPLSGLN